MKILKAKQLPTKKDFTHKEICGNCGSKLLVEYDDVYLTGDIFHTTRFDCPLCGERNFLAPKYYDIYHKIMRTEQ